MVGSLKASKVLSKTELRQQLRSSGTKQKQIEEMGNFSNSPLRNFLEKQTGVWAAFLPFGSEPPIGSVLELLPESYPDTKSDSVPSIAHQKAGGLRWVAPRLDGEEMIFHECSVNEFAAPVAKVFREPALDGRAVSPSEIVGALVPGLAFDRNGGRLGRGRGYYDRFLQNWNGIKVGVCWSHSLVSEVPMEEHDVKMDWIATEDEFIQTPSFAEKGKS